MAKVIDFDEAKKKVEDMSNKINILMSNRLIIAILLIVDGINFILNPNGSMRDLARGVAFVVLLGSFSLLITNLFSKNKNIKTLVISLLVVILSIISIIFPTAIASYIKFILALIIIFNGILNVLNILKLDKLKLYTFYFEKQLKGFIHDANISQEFEEGVKEQTDRIVSSVNGVIKKSNKNSYFSLIVNIVSIILGILLFVLPNVTIITFGLIFIYTGILDFAFVFKSKNIAKKIKDKKFKEILFDEQEHIEEVNIALKQ